MSQDAFLKKTLIITALAVSGGTPIFAFSQVHTEHATESHQAGKPTAHFFGQSHVSVHGVEMGLGNMPMQDRTASADALSMPDMHKFGAVKFERLEYVKARGDEWLAYEGEMSYGNAYNRAVVKAEGEVASGRLQESETELLWRHAVTTLLNTELGVRFDYEREVANREWLAFGIKGATPYELEGVITAYVGPSGRTALVFKGEYELALTQTLYLQPSVEVSFHGKDDEEVELGTGLTDTRIGVRLKKEITGQLKPYIGLEWAGKFGKTADYAREDGEPRRETRFVAGLSFRF